MKIELPEKEGYEWEECSRGEWGDLSDKECARLYVTGGVTFYRLVPKLKYYDWKNTDNRVLVNTGETVERLDAAIKVRESEHACQGWTLTDDWIPVIDGECPFDIRSVVVSVIFRDDSTVTRKAMDLNWSLRGSDTDIACARFVKLKDGFTF